MKFWTINVATEKNKHHMILNKKAYIGLGLSGEIPNKCDNPTKYNKARTNRNSTPFQFSYFNNNKEKGDIIVLYENKIGHIYYGKITGEITKPIKGIDLAPDWDINEIQYHIKVVGWTKIENPHMKNCRRKTLTEITENDFNSILDKHI